MSFLVLCSKCGTSNPVRESDAGQRVRCVKCNRLMSVPTIEQRPKTRKDTAGKDLLPEYTESGDQVHREQAPERGFDLAIGDSESIDAITKHIEQHVGKIDSVFHEIMSDLVHIDVHVVKPTKKKPYYTLVTSGMSDRPMTVPQGCEEDRFAELTISLPQDWPLSQKAFDDENNYWPIRVLKYMARFPHEYQSWLGFGHSIPNGDPAKPFADNVGFCCALLAPPILHGDGFSDLEVNEDKTIHFYAVLPLYREEMEYKLKHRTESLLERFDSNQINELLDIARPHVCKRKERSG